MKVLLVANYEPDAQNSMLAFKRVLERELPATGCEVRVLSPPPRMLKLPHRRRWRKWFAYIDKFVLFLPALRRQARWADVVHVADHSNAMYVPWVRGRPSLVTCHDVISVQAARGMVEGWDVGRTGRLFQHLISKGLHQADLIACDSDLTRNDLLALGISEAGKVTTLVLGLNDDFAPVEPAEAARLLGRFGIAAEQRYLLHVGLNLQRKNRTNVLKSFIALQQRAAAAGTEAVVRLMLFIGPEFDDEQQAVLKASGLQDRVRRIEGVSHDELRALYSSATALLFPSLHEGFGWPVIEAQACGCPVFTSDIAPMNEIGGTAAVYVDPRDPEGIASAIEQAAPRLAAMRAEGLRNAAGYSAAKMAAKYKTVYGQAIARHKAEQ